MTSRKITPNIALKQAIVGTGKTQRIISLRTRIAEVRLSKIVRGKAVPTEDEKDALAQITKRPIHDLFPSEARA